jgi:arsenate reductase-like glutaredoxin family protein
VKAQGYLARKRVEPKESVDAGKTKLGRAEALQLAKSAKKVVVARGAKVVVFDMAKDPPSDGDLLAVILGPTGNLRAPTFRRGTTLVVGFNEDAYAGALT